jgi:hypothetical protein
MSEAEQQEQVRQSVQNIADRAAREAVKDVLTHLGFDLSDPIKAQEQFAAMRKLTTNPNIARDLDWLNELHTSADKVRDVSLTTATRLIITAILGSIALGTKEWWLSHITNLFK